MIVLSCRHLKQEHGANTIFDDYKERRQAREQAIAQADQRLAETDAALEQAQAAGDLTGLSERWTEREEVQQQLDTLYQRWMEVEEGES